jgi:hypothetical protein
MKKTIANCLQRIEEYKNALLQLFKGITVMNNNQRDSLSTLSNIASIANYFQLTGIKNNSDKVQNELSMVNAQRQQENTQKELLFKIKQFIKSEVEKSNDVLAKAVFYQTIGQIIERGNINTSSFSQIADKEYCSEVLSLVNAKIVETNYLSADADQIIILYRRATVILPYLKNYLNAAKVSISDKDNSAIFNFIRIATIFGSILLFISSPSNEMFLFCVVIAIILIIIIQSVENHENINIKDIAGIISPILDLGNYSTEPSEIINLCKSISFQEEQLSEQISKIETEHPDLRIFRKFLWN